MHDLAYAISGGTVPVTLDFFTPASRVDTRMVDVGGHALHVSRYDGNGPEVLLIHGIGSSSRDFDPVIDDLVQVMTPVTVDLRGHGESDKPLTGYHYDDYVQDLKRLLTALRMDRPIILGHSLGGIITLWWAIRHPEEARALIIEDSPLRSGEEFRPAFEGWITLNNMPFEAVQAYYRKENPHWPDHLVTARAWDITNTASAVFPELMAASMSNDGLDATDGMRNIGSPILFIHGDRDRGSMVHPDDLAAMHQRLPSARLAHIPGGGHSMHRGEMSAQWVKIVKEYMGDIR
jgi:pimeloyl-ACP methyl ester carboxylesterase